MWNCDWGCENGGGTFANYLNRFCRAPTAITTTSGGFIPPLIAPDQGKLGSAIQTCQSGFPVIQMQNPQIFADQTHFTLGYPDLNAVGISTSLPGFQPNNPVWSSLNAQGNDGLQYCVPCIRDDQCRNPVYRAASTIGGAASDIICSFVADTVVGAHSNGVCVQNQYSCNIAFCASCSGPSACETCNDGSITIKSSVSSESTFSNLEF